MNPATRVLLLGAALLPYVALAGYDAWMHERARRVPRVEQALHAAAALAFLVFVFTALRGNNLPALGALAAFGVATACDEIGFHRGLAIRERRVHFAAYAALCLFLGAWALLPSS